MENQGNHALGLYQLLQDLMHFLQELDRKGSIPDENYGAYTQLLEKAKRRLLQHYNHELENQGE
jgi:hypothetical protein